MNKPNDIARRYAPTQTEARNLEEDITAFGKEQKKNGAKSFAKLVRDMRSTQKTYFQSKSNQSLNKAKELEKQVDRAVEVILGGKHA